MKFVGSNEMNCSRSLCLSAFIPLCKANVYGDEKSVNKNKSFQPMTQYNEKFTGSQQTYTAPQAIHIQNVKEFHTAKAMHANQC